MVQVQFYTKDNCLLCDDAYALLMLLQNDYPFELQEIDIYTDDALLEEYQLIIPAVRMNDILLTGADVNLEQLDKIFKDNIRK